MYMYILYFCMIMCMWENDGSMATTNYCLWSLVMYHHTSVWLLCSVIIGGDV